MSAFDEIMGATPSRRGNNAKKGRYKMRIEKVIEKKGYKGHSFIVEARVLEATQTDEDEKPSPVGASVSFVMKLSKDGAGGDAAKGNAQAIIVALFAGLGHGPGDISKEKYEKMIASNSFRGIDAFVESYNTTIQTGPNAGKPFTGFNWSPVEGQTADTVKRNRTELDGSKPKATPAEAKPVTTVAPQAKPAAGKFDLDDL